MKNYLSWCSVSVGGATASTAAQQVVCVPTGPTGLAASPASTAFELDPNGTWHGTDGDTGSGDKGTISGMTSSTIVTVNTPGAKCVWACCPFQGGTGCPTTTQCP